MPMEQARVVKTAESCALASRKLGLLAEIRLGERL
jgi:hypothetical protein